MPRPNRMRASSATLACAASIEGQRDPGLIQERIQICYRLVTVTVAPGQHGAGLDVIDHRHQPLRIRGKPCEQGRG